MERKEYDLEKLDEILEDKMDLIVENLLEKIAPRVDEIIN